MATSPPNAKLVVEPKAATPATGPLATAMPLWCDRGPGGATMPIEFACPCGKQYRVKDDKAGRTVRCVACQADLEVPALDGVDLGIVTEDQPALAAPKTAPSSVVSRPDGEDLARVIAK